MLRPGARGERPRVRDDGCAGCYLLYVYSQFWRGRITSSRTCSSRRGWADNFLNSWTPDCAAREQRAEAPASKQLFVRGFVYVEALVVTFLPP